MNNEEQLKHLEDVERNHSFWVDEAVKAWREMFVLAFDFSSQSTEKFKAAKERCELARNRARKEFARLNISI